MQSQTQTSEIVATIAAQIKALSPSLFMKVKALIEVDTNTLRLHFRERTGVFNVDIHYDGGMDLYNLKAYKVKGVKVEVVKDIEGLYVDQLAETICLALGFVFED